MEASGYTVIQARQALHALEIAQRRPAPIHLLITDVVMPGMSGRDLAESLAASHAETRVLYMSGYTDDAVVLHGVLAAEMAFLQKPFTGDALARRCERSSTVKRGSTASVRGLRAARHPR
jgi:two-component system cell cycle sensor histidine kinase/response regulator CckA